jgi:hypothetical protein
MVTKLGRCAALFAALGVMGCATIVGLDDDYQHGGGTFGGGSGGGPGSGGTTSTAAGGGGAMGCVPIVAPGSPGGADDGGNVDFVTALRKIDLDETKSDVTIGLDLDGLCTCQDGGATSCKPLIEKVCDGPGGIDNSLGLIFAKVHEISVGVITSAQISNAADKGSWTSLLRVRGYNGKPDDAKVEALMYTTQGVNAGMPAPKWDGMDAWPIDKASLKSPPNVDSAVTVSTDAYVTNGVLVVHLPKQRLRIRSTLFKMDLELVNVVIQATLKPAVGGYSLTDGVTAGEWSLANAFKDIASIRYAGDTKLCTDDNDFVTVKSVVCANPDLRVDGSGNGSEACDALSFGATFSADPAQLGPIVPDEGPPDNPCAANKDPSTDTCD